MSVESLERLRLKAEETDRKVSLLLTFAPPILFFLGYLAFLVSLPALEAYTPPPMHGVVTVADQQASWSVLPLLAALSFLLAGIILGLYLVYLWISRRNKHFERTLEFYSVLAEILEAEGFSFHASSVKDWVSRMRLEQGENRSPALWLTVYILSSLFPIVGLIVTFSIFIIS
ncbi:MAG: hypothetical protein DRO46_01595 [Candidatus Hecatellales archaeon]|nr:MAG: hypothetical protein DRO46_01595 [Candidatus Hecatellales archaeon]